MKLLQRNPLRGLQTFIENITKHSRIDAPSVIERNCLMLNYQHVFVVHTYI